MRNAVELIIIFIAFVFLILSGTGVAAPLLSNSGGGSWQYYKEITIKENSGSTLIDYQVLVQLSGSDFPSSARSDGADIRFADANGNELNYWIESWDHSGKSAGIWVKVPKISGRATVAIRMYNGNPSALSMSNGAATFDFFDDFEDGNLNDKWISGSDPCGNNSNTIRLKLGRVEATNNCNYIETLQGFSGDLAVTVDVEKAGSTEDMSCWDFYIHWVGSGVQGSLRYEWDGVDGININGCGDAFTIPASNPNKGVVTLFAEGGIYKFSYMNINGVTLTTNDYSSNLNRYKLRIWLAGSPNVPRLVDNVRVRKYTFSEPRVTPGAEQLISTSTPASVPATPTPILATTPGSITSPAVSSWIDKALEPNPDNLDSLYHKVGLLDNLGRRQEANALAYEVIDKCDKLIAVNSNNFDAWHYKGSLLNFLGKYDEGLNASNKAISINANNQHTWYVKGEALFALRRYQEAIDAFDKAIKLDPNLPHFWRSKGDALKALGRHQEANEAYDKANELTTKASSIDGLKYFSVILLMSLVILAIVFFYEKRYKNNMKFRTDLKMKHPYAYYFALIGNSIIGIIWLIITLTVSFKELPLNSDQGKFFFTIVIFFLSLSSFILTASLLRSRPVLKLNGLHFLISLIMGLLFLFVKLTNPQDNMPFFIPVLLLMSSAISVWYHRIAVFKPPSQELFGEQKDAEVSIPMLNIKRGYSVLPNNDIKFGIRLTNETGYTITNVDTILDYSEELFNIKESKIQSIGNITPKGARTISYILKPLGCIHNEQINALITYKDHTGKKQMLHMSPKEVHCVCPFLKEKPMSEGEYGRLTASSEFMQEGISFKGISVEDLAKFMGETCRHMLHKVREYDIEGKKVIYLSGESVGEKAYYLLTAVIQEYKGLTQVVLRAHSDKKYGLNGFMNEMADSLRHLVASVQNAKEIGIIENTQVINIIDSVVQRTNFQMGEGGNAQVNKKTL